MKRAVTLAMGIFCLCVIVSASPKANPKAVVTCGNARFTVLTDRMVRMEWSENAEFEDRASLAIINRDLPVPSFSVRRSGDGVTIKTRSLTLTYSGEGRFSPENLAVAFDGGGWKPGAAASGNLLGTVRTLDGCRGFGQVSYSETTLEPGILSMDGWAIIDESGRPLFEASDSDWENLLVENPAPERIDWYIMAYGHDYKTALYDYTQVAGKVPMPPKFTLGYWWSRYWSYTDEEFLEIADDIRNNDIPADVFIIDMGWHKYWNELWDKSRRDEFGQRIEWTGYSWNRDLIREPERLLADLHSRGYKTALNLHPASGIRPIEDCYEAFRADYLSRTDDYDGPKDYIYPQGGYTFKGNEEATGAAGEPAPVPFRLEQQAWADAYFGSVLAPIQKQGVDFWWMDWQQWMQSKYSPSIGNTFICNYMFWQDKVRQGGDRPLIYHRWGGLGSHRYQLGFSGDSYDEWSTLKFIPYFTATASNVCYGYWGHDIGGHQQLKGKARPTDPELFTRWLQNAVFTPIFKTHSTQSAYLERKIWLFPTHFEYMRDAIRLRYILTPYIYTAARQAYDTGVCLCRPLYYEYPEDFRAYSFNEEYFFGDDILATVLCEPADTTTGLTRREIWFPSDCDWYDMAAHCIHRGGPSTMLEYSIDQNPWFVKAGAVLPIAPRGLKNLQEETGDFRILVVPGGGKSSCSLYEDNGIGRDYPEVFSRTAIRKKAKGGSVTLAIAPRDGKYSGPATRRISIVLEGVTEAPAKVKVNGKSIAVDALPAENALSTKALEIRLPESSSTARQKVKIIF